MSYSIVRSATGGPDMLVENPDPALMTREAREELARSVREIREEILERRGGLPLDVDALHEEVRAERGLHCEGVRDTFGQEVGEEGEVATEDTALTAPLEERPTRNRESGRIRPMSYSIVRSATEDLDMLVEDPDPALCTQEALDALAQEILQVRKDILQERKGVPMDVDQMLEEMRSERGAHCA